MKRNQAFNPGLFRAALAWYGDTPPKAAEWMTTEIGEEISARAVRSWARGEKYPSAHKSVQAVKAYMTRDDGLLAFLEDRDDEQWARKMVAERDLDVRLP